MDLAGARQDIAVLTKRTRQQQSHIEALSADITRAVRRATKSAV